MKKALSLWLASTLSLSLVTGSTLAATASVETEVSTLHDPNGVSRMFGCGNHDNCRRSSVNNAPLLATDPDGVSASSNLHFAFFAATNTSSVPNFLHTGTAHARALLGSLHASAEVELTGLGGDGGPHQGVSAVAVVAVQDKIRVQSSTLAAGTVVTLNVLMNVSGQGRASAGVTVQDLSRPVNGFFHDINHATSNLASVESISGQFTAEVGSLLTIDYFLRASAGVSNGLWKAEHVANGRAASSDYGNSAYLYFSAADPVNVSLEGLSGYDYVQPNPVPLPAALWLMMPGLVVLARRRRMAGGAVNTLP